MINQDLQAAIAQLGRFLSTRAGRTTLRSNGYANGTQIVPAVEGELLRDVFDRVRAYPPPVLVAVHFADRVGPAQWEFLDLRPGSPTQEEAEDEDRWTRVQGRDLTIGMFVDASGRGVSQGYRFSWENVEIRTFEPAPA